MNLANTTLAFSDGHVTSAAGGDLLAACQKMEVVNKAAGVFFFSNDADVVINFK